MKRRPELIELVKRAAVDAKEISRAEADRIRHAWDETFGRAVLAWTGKPIYGGFRWHAFSWGFTRAEQGKRAKELYLAERGAEWIVFHENEEAPVFALGGCGPIDLGPCGSDLYVVPASLAWTMVFTHEQPHIGPFFCKREWAEVEPRRGPMNRVYFACADHRRYVDAGYRWASSTLEEAGIVRRDRAIELDRVLAAEAYWNPPVADDTAWLREDILPTARAFLQRHAGHHLTYTEGDGFIDGDWRQLERYDEEESS